MDIDAIQEFSENQCYLNELAVANGQRVVRIVLPSWHSTGCCRKVQLILLPVTDADVRGHQETESLDAILNVISALDYGMSPRADVVGATGKDSLPSVRSSRSCTGRVALSGTTAGVECVADRVQGVE